MSFLHPSRRFAPKCSQFFLSNLVISHVPNNPICCVCGTWNFTRQRKCVACCTPHSGGVQWCFTMYALESPWQNVVGLLFFLPSFVKPIREKGLLFRKARPGITVQHVRNHTRFAWHHRVRERRLGHLSMGAFSGAAPMMKTDDAAELFIRMVCRHEGKNVALWGVITINS